MVEIASVLTGISELRNEVPCEEYVKEGIEYGLVSMGVPPSSPSWTELKHQGASYLAAQVASATGDPTGIKADITKEQLLDMVEETNEVQTAIRGGNDPRSSIWGQIKNSCAKRFSVRVKITVGNSWR